MLEKDVWKEWLLDRRFGGDEAFMRRTLDDVLFPIRDRVLDGVALEAGETLLDVGCGDGLIAFGALERGAGQVIFCDISQELLEVAKSLAQQMGVDGRCHFINAAAESLTPVADSSVDGVTTRSVLIYVADKRAAFAEFYRVLRPGGRLSLFEPINRFGYPPPRHIFLGYDVTAVMEIADKVKAVYLELQPPETDPMLNFDERNLLEMAEAAGFTEIRLDLVVEIKPLTEPQDWERMLNTAGNPKIPTLAEAMEQALTPVEREQLIACLRPQVETAQGKTRRSLAYLQAVK